MLESTLAVSVEPRFLLTPRCKYGGQPALHLLSVIKFHAQFCADDACRALGVDSGVARIVCLDGRKLTALLAMRAAELQNWASERCIPLFFCCSDASRW